VRRLTPRDAPATARPRCPCSAVHPLGGPPNARAPARTPAAPPQPPLPARRSPARSSAATWCLTRCLFWRGARAARCGRRRAQAGACGRMRAHGGNQRGPPRRAVVARRHARRHTAAGPLSPSLRARAARAPPNSPRPNPNPPPHPSQDAKAYCREIVVFLRTLKASRDMSPNEVKLVVAIESPEARERRKLGIEVGRGRGGGGVPVAHAPPPPPPPPWGRARRARAEPALPAPPPAGRARRVARRDGGGARRCRGRPHPQGPRRAQVPVRGDGVVARRRRVARGERRGLSRAARAVARGAARGGLLSRCRFPVCAYRGRPAPWRRVCM
jgi:hypothetical protein